MAKGKTDMDSRPNTLMENKLVLCELRSHNKIDHKSSHELNKLIARFNAKNTLRMSKNAKASLGTKQEMIIDNPYGHVNGFPPGSWWGIRMDCSRDGVHEPFNENIQDGPLGAVSLCTSRLSTNNDVDLGDYLTYTGNDYEPGRQLFHPLVSNYQNQVPLRLIRSYNLGNDYAPKTGYRYDGLYAVIATWIGVTSKTEKYYKFALARLPHQDPSDWQLSRKKTVKQDSRVNNSTFPTSDCTISQNNSNYRETTRANVRSRSFTKRCSLKKFNVSRIDAMTSDAKRNNHESAIVTRCISKKTECSPASGMVSVPYGETSFSCYNRSFGNSESPVCKLQNTNISIRTDLYDSSNGLLQETRKITPMTFCRTYKSSGLPARIANHSNVVTLNLNSCGPCPRDTVQESLIQSRSGIGKFSSDQSSSSERSTDRSTPKSSIIVQTDDKTNFDDDTSSIGQKRVLDNKSNCKENAVKKMPNVEKICDKDTCDEEITVGTKSDDTLETTTLNESEINEEKSLKESHADIDLMTPDKMLNFIVKQKYHPTAKLLIGSVIGLATGESTILKAYESLMSRQNRWCRTKTTRTLNNEVTPLKGKEENLSFIDSRDCENKQKPSSTDGSNERISSKNVTKKRVLGDSNDRLMRKMRLRRTRFSKRLLTTDKKTSTKSVVGTSTSQRLRKSNKTAIKSQQAFSKSMIMKKSDKRAKKRRGELANLVIDANIGPIVRGPRNRRLRCGTHIYEKKRHGNKDIPSCCAEKMPNVTRSKKEIHRVELTTRKSKTENSRISESRFSSTNKRVRRNERLDHEQVKIVEAGVNDFQQNCRKNVSGKGEKRKLSSTRSNDSVDDESRKILCNVTSKNLDIQRSLRMVDASTQCSTSRRDVTTSVDREIPEKRPDNFLNSVKIEWIDVDDVKPEIPEINDEYERSSHGTSPELQIFPSFNETWSNQRDFPMTPRYHEPRGIVGQRLSAFVPVNVTDDDMRIVRLRSIDFRPIQSSSDFQDAKQSSNVYDENSPSSSAKNSSVTPAVMCRDVDELFNKYTSEETTVVGYMDQELRYQDIEDEEIGNVRKSTKVYGNAKRGRRCMKVGNKKVNSEKIDVIESTSRDERETLIDEDTEVPWHGWKKYVKNKQAQWTGW